MNDAPSHGADLCRQLQLVDEYLASYVNSIRFANQQLVSCMTSLSDTNNYIACSFCTKTGKKARMWMSISWWRGMCCTPGRLSSGNRTNATFLDISAEIPSSLKPRKRSTGKWDPPPIVLPQSTLLLLTEWVRWGVLRITAALLSALVWALRHVQTCVKSGCRKLHFPFSADVEPVITGLHKDTEIHFFLSSWLLLGSPRNVCI